MKQKSRISCLAVLFAVIAFLLPAAAHSQITYRGFVETGAGLNMNHKSSFTYTLSTTHGIQFRRNFLGVGAGIQTGFMMYINSYYDGEYWYNPSLMMPLYLAYRYDAFRTQKFNFFGDMNIGIFVDPEGDFAPSPYLKFGGGLRQRISNRCGLSYGVHYYISHHKDYSENMGVLLSIGLDF